MIFRVSIILVYLLLVGDLPYASPSRRLKFDPDAWVNAKVDALVPAARAAFEDDEALPAYERVLNSMAATLRRRGLSEDEGFASRYRELIDYIQVASLDQQPDHELGFIVPDRQYFEETRPYVQ